MKGSRKGGFVTSAAEEWGMIDGSGMSAGSGRTLRTQRSAGNGLLSVGWRGNSREGRGSSRERRERLGDGWWGS